MSGGGKGKEKIGGLKAKRIQSHDRFSSPFFEGQIGGACFSSHTFILAPLLVFQSMMAEGKQKSRKM